MSTNKENLTLWNQVNETDTKFTKDIEGTGLTSINATYLFQKATELWGPFGEKWGATIVKEEYKEGANITLWNQDGTPFNTGEKSQIHTCQIEFFYPADQEKVSFTAFGETPFVYMAYDKFSRPYVHTDFEVKKKSFTDAIKKALSMLGFSADIFMGLYEDETYREAISKKKEIESSIDQVTATSEAIEELEEWLNKQLNTYAVIKHKTSLQTVFDKNKEELKLRCKMLDIDDRKYLKQQMEVFKPLIDNLDK